MTFTATSNNLQFTAAAAALSTEIQNSYDITVTASLPDISSVTKTYKMHLIQLSSTYITAPVITNPEYYVGDSKLSYNIPLFTKSDSRFTISYTLTDSSG
jgi:hypothetical protein